MKRPPVDWTKVPVRIVGTPNPEGLRLLAEAIWEWQLSNPLLLPPQGESEVEVVEVVLDVDAVSS